VGTSDRRSRAETPIWRVEAGDLFLSLELAEKSTFHPCMRLSACQRKLIELGGGTHMVVNENIQAVDWIRYAMDRPTQHQICPLVGGFSM
jgi:hypothetical protein